MHLNQLGTLDNGAVTYTASPTLDIGIDHAIYEDYVVQGIACIEAMSSEHLKLTRLCGMIEHHTQHACIQRGYDEIETAKRVSKVLSIYAHDIHSGVKSVKEHARVFRFYGGVMLAWVELLLPNIFYSHIRRVAQWLGNYPILDDSEKLELAVAILEYVSDEDWRYDRLDVEIKKICGLITEDEYKPNRFDIEIEGEHVKTVAKYLNINLNPHMRYRVRIDAL